MLRCCRSLPGHRFAEHERRDDRSVEVEAKRFLERVEGNVENARRVIPGARNVAAGGVDQNVRRTPMIEERVSRRPQRAFVERVGDEWQRLASCGANCRDFVVDGISATTENRRSCALCGQPVGQSASEYAVSADDDSDFSRQREGLASDTDVPFNFFHLEVR